jgi:hypothetical protein
VTEADFQKVVIDLAHIFGWKVAHFRPAKTSKGWRTPVAADGAGFPDLVMARGGDLIAVELKVGKNRTTRQQDDWLDRFPRAFVWKPEDLETDIIEVLR